MNIFWTIVCAVGVAICARCADAALEEVVEKNENGEKKKFSTFIKDVFASNPSGWIRAILLGVVYALPIFFLSLGTVWLWIMLAVEIAAMVYIATWWYRAGSKWGELVPFVVMEVLFFISAFILAGVLAETYGNLVMLVPEVVFVGVLGSMMANLLHYKGSKAVPKEGDSDELKKEKEADAKKYGTLWKVVAGLTLLVVIAMIFFGVRGNLKNSDTNDGADTTTTTEETADVGEVEDILVKWTKHDLNRIDSEFNDKLKKEAGDGEITPEIVKKVILEDCKDPEQLAFWSWMFGLRDKQDDYEALMVKEGDKEKLSDEGRDLYNQLKGYLKAEAAVSMEREEAPEDGTNTGYEGGFVVAETAGIDGNRSGTKVTLPNGDIFWIMDRCANVVYPGGKNPPKDIPRGNTDNPKKDPSEDPVNQGNAKKGGGQNRPSDGPGENQPVDPRTENPTGPQNDNNHGHSDPATVTPSNPAPTKPAVTDSNPMNYKPDSVTNNGPADSSKKPTSSEGDGEFTPSD